MQITKLGKYWGLVVLALALFTGRQLFAGVTASISGTVKDPSGAAIAGATVTATNTGTGIAQSQTTNGQGYYSFQSLPLGKYTVDIQQKGFKTYPQTEITVDVNAALTVDVTLQVGQTRARKWKSRPMRCTSKQVRLRWAR